MRSNAFHKDWLLCLQELGMPSNHFAWAMAKPPVAFPKPPRPYSLISVLSFDEEEYANHPADGGT